MAVLKLTDSEFNEMEKVAREQIAYTHPLKYATASMWNNIGRHNLHVLRDLRRLRNTIKRTINEKGRNHN